MSIAYCRDCYESYCHCGNPSGKEVFGQTRVALAKQRDEIRNYVENTLILLGVEHGGHKMKDGWISYEELIEFLDSLEDK
jgi:hypothetical protein